MAPAAADDVRELTLDNGLTVLLRPMETDTVCVLACFAVGEAHDPDGASGLAHLCEHLYFTCGAGDAPVRTANEAMQAYPKGWQAQVGRDYTVIATVVPKDGLAAEIGRAADRMGDLRITDEDVAREQGRILLEVGNMFGENPGTQGLAAFNHARERAVPSPEGARRGGLPARVKELSASQARAFWSRFLKPANATLVIAGGFDPNAVTMIVKQRFARIPGGQPPVARAGGAPRHGLETIHVPRRGAGPATLPVVTVAHAAPAPGDERFPAFLFVVARLVAQSLMGRTTPAAFPPPAYYAFLDGPEALCLSRRVAGAQEPKAVAASLGREIEAACKKPIGRFDRKRVTHFLGTHLGLPGTRGVDPYGVL